MGACWPFTKTSQNLKNSNYSFQNKSKIKHFLFANKKINQIIISKIVFKYLFSCNVTFKDSFYYLLIPFILKVVQNLTIHSLNVCVYEFFFYFLCSFLCTSLTIYTQRILFLNFVIVYIWYYQQENEKINMAYKWIHC